MEPTTIIIVAGLGAASVLGSVWMFTIGAKQAVEKSVIAKVIKAAADHETRIKRLESDSSVRAALPKGVGRGLKGIR